MAHNPNMANLVMYYSGGGANSTTTASIGGAISSARVTSQTSTALTTLTGVTIDDAMGNGEGDGTLSYASATKTLTWQPQNGSAGTPVTITEDGVWFIQGYNNGVNNGGALCVTVVYASLPTINISNTVTIANRTEKMFLNLTEDETNTGVNKYHCFALKNTHGTKKIVDIKMWVSKNREGASESLYLDPLAASNGAVGPTAVANENTAPGGSTFVVPTSSTDAAVLSFGTLLAGQVRFFWRKEATPAGLDTAVTANTFVASISMRG